MVIIRNKNKNTKLLSQIDSPLLMEEFFDFFSRSHIFSFIKFSSLEVLSYHVGERMKEEFKRSLVSVILLPLYLIHYLIEVGYDIMRIGGSFEYEIIVIRDCMDNNISLVENRIENGGGINLSPLYIGVFHI